MQFAKSTSVRECAYTLLDASKTNMESSKDTIAKWCAGNGAKISRNSDSYWEIEFGQTRFDLIFQVADVLEVPHSLGNPYNAVIAQCVLDYFSVSVIEKTVHQLLASGGLFYSAINFDGVTTFVPVESPLDEQVAALYHTSMSRHTPHGLSMGPRTGRLVLSYLLDNDWDVIKADSSDWIVLPERSSVSDTASRSASDEAEITAGRVYAGEEEYFLRCMLHFIEDELSGHSDIDETAFSAWLSLRRKQLEERRLGLITHQLDILAQKL